MCPQTVFAFSAGPNNNTWMLLKMFHMSLCGHQIDWIEREVVNKGSHNEERVKGTIETRRMRTRPLSEWCVLPRRWIDVMPSCLLYNLCRRSSANPWPPFDHTEALHQQGHGRTLTPLCCSGLGMRGSARTCLTLTSPHSRPWHRGSSSLGPVAVATIVRGRG